VKQTRTSSKNLTELSEYIATAGKNADLATIATMIDNLHEVVIETNDKVLSENAIDTVFPGALKLTTEQIEKLNSLLPWSTLVAYRGTLQGAPWDNKKRAAVHSIPDAHIKGLRPWIEGKRVLEIGCHEGVYTLGLAKYAASVVALDGRMDNIIKTLTRVWLANKSKAIQVVCNNLEDLNVSRLGKADSEGYIFDLIHHNGVLYHLSNPLAHLDNILDNNPSRVLFLDTHVASETKCKHIYNHGGLTYNVHKYAEPASRSYSPFAGISADSIWLRMDDLIDYLRKKGFGTIEEKSLREERNGLRCRILCKK
jgi:2-polyprenyl-3-methyl-5-hydroxy-6-metoxy-1,4-benzoquinol methylase